MSIYNITEITVAGAYGNAMDAARNSDRRASRNRPSASAETARFAPAAIWNILCDALHHFGRAGRAQTV